MTTLVNCTLLKARFSPRLTALIFFAFWSPSPDAQMTLLEGTWQFKFLFAENTFVFNGNNFTFTTIFDENRAEIVGEFEIDTTMDPSWIDLYLVIDGLRFFFQQGVFEIRGDTLLINLVFESGEEERPSELDEENPLNRYTRVADEQDDLECNTELSHDLGTASGHASLVLTPSNGDTLATISGAVTVSGVTGDVSVELVNTDDQTKVELAVGGLADGLIMLDNVEIDEATESALRIAGNFGIWVTDSSDPPIVLKGEIICVETMALDGEGEGEGEGQDTDGGRREREGEGAVEMDGEGEGAGSEGEGEGAADGEGEGETPRVSACAASPVGTTPPHMPRGDIALFVLVGLNLLRPLWRRSYAYSLPRHPDPPRGRSVAAHQARHPAVASTLNS